MRRIIVSILQLLGYFLLFLVVTVAVMAPTKIFIGDWDSGDPSTKLLGNGLLTSLARLSHFEA